MELPERILGRITRKAGRAISDFRMIREGDRILVGLSGGESSFALLCALEKLRSKSPVGFEIFPHTAEPTPSSFAELKRQLLEVAGRKSLNKIALGSDADDLVETLLLSELYEGEIRSLPPVETDTTSKIAFIRPLCRVFRKDILEYAAAEWFSPARRFSPPEDPRLRPVRKILENLEGERPGIKANLLSSLGRVRKRYLMDEKCRI